MVFIFRISLPFLTNFFLRLPKIKGWIDEHNPGDPLIPFSVALEERLVAMEPADREAEQKTLGAVSALSKITQAGYSSLDVCCHFGAFS
jgi:obg-like ATPase 1